MNTSYTTTQHTPGSGSSWEQSYTGHSRPEVAPVIKVFCSRTLNTEHRTTEDVK
jgi:hypothetical protein